MPASSRSTSLGGSGRGRLALLLLLPLLATCSEYRDRDDHISMQLGDAVEVNKVVHVANPWPAGATRANLPYNAERMLVGYGNYRAKADPMKTQAPSDGGATAAADTAASPTAGDDAK
jgi:hypothetical protein